MFVIRRYEAVEGSTVKLDCNWSARVEVSSYGVSRVIMI
jgi:hypothetical protein